MSKYSDWEGRVNTRGMMPREGVKQGTFYRRDDILKGEGFARFERDAFCTGRISTGAMRTMRTERRAEFLDWLDDVGRDIADAQDLATALEVWTSVVEDNYEDEGWRFLDGGFNPWDYLEDVRTRKGKRKTPTYRKGGRYGEQDVLDAMVAGR